MALAVTARGTAASNASSSTTYAFSPGSNFAAGSLAVIAISADNSSSGGSTNNISTVTDSIGNTWTKRNSAVYDPGAASAGIQGSIFDCKQEVGLLTTGTTITITFGASTTAKSYALWQLTAAAGYQAAYNNSANGTGGATASPTVTTASLTNGDAVVGAVVGEAGTEQTHTADSDTSNGSWSSAQYSEVGSTTGGNVIASQVKVVSATATQTYNPTFANSMDCIAIWASYRETSNVQTLTVGLIDASSAIYAPTVAFAPKTLTVGLIDASSAIYAPTLTPKSTITLGLIDAIGAAASYSAEVQSDSPTLYFRLGESSGTTADNAGSTGSGYDGTYTGTYTLGSTGALSGDSDTAVAFTDGYVRVAQGGSAAHPASPFSFECWFKRTATGAEHVIWNGGSVAGCMIIKINTTDVLAVRAYGVGNCWVSTGTFTDSNWHHLVYTKSGSTSTVYIDGSAISGTTTDQTFSTTADYGYIGKSVPDSTSPWVGSIDEFAIYGTALSSTRVAAHYTAGTTTGGGERIFALDVAHAGAAAQNIAIGLLDGGSALYAPTLTVGPVTAALSLIDATSALYAITLTPKNLVTIGLIESGSALYAPTLTVGPVTAALGLIDAGRNLWAPVLAPQPVTVAIGLLDSGSALYAPALATRNTLTLGLIDAGSAIYAPAVGFSVALPLIDSGPTLYAPALSFVVSLGLIDAGSAIYAPTLTVGPVTAALPLIDAGSGIYDLVVTKASGPQTVVLDFIDAAPAIYALVLAAKNTLTPGLIDSGSAIYAVVLAPQPVTAALALIDSGSAIYAPTLTVGPVTATLPLIDGARNLWAPVATWFNTFTAPLLDGGSALYAPVPSLAPYPIVLGLIDGGSAILDLTVGHAATVQAIVVPLIDASPGLYEPTVTWSSTLVLGLVDGGADLWPPVPANASATITGHTRDVNGRVIPNATVDVFVAATNAFFTTTTSGPTGLYQVTVAPGVQYFIVAYTLVAYGTSARDLVGV